MTDVSERWIEDPGSAPAPTIALDALGRARRGDWEGAHHLIQDLAGDDAAWVHAWLHRAEGDAGNAAYWYRRAGRPVASGPLEDEWRAIATALLGAQRRTPA